MPLSLNQLQAGGVHFSIPTAAFDPRHHHYAAACLASGLKRLGIPVYADVRHPLFAEFQPDRPLPPLRLLVVTQENTSAELFNQIAACDAPEKFILSMADTTSAIFTPPGIPSLMAHENRFRRMSGARLPWAFGLSDELMQGTANPPPFDRRSPTILRNFRPSGNQHVRNVCDWSLLPHLEKHFQIDQKIASDHHDRLRSHVGCLAYGGTWEEDLMAHPEIAAQSWHQEYREHVALAQPLAILRWDSWRWWESLSAGCLTFQLDFEKFGLLLPVMPVAWEHYIPVEFSDPKGTVERLMDERPRWAQIADNGRRWAHDHYSPEAVARRLVDYVAPA